MRRERADALVDWPLQEGLMLGSCAPGEVTLGQHPGHTKHAFAIGPSVVQDTQNGPEQPIPEGCNGTERKE